MAEVKEDDLLPGEVSEDDLAPEEASDTTTVQPDGTVRRELVKVAPDLDFPETPKEPSILDRAIDSVSDTVREGLNPKTGTGAFARGVESGVSLGWADELTGLLEAANKVDADRERVMGEVVDAKEKGTFDPSAAAPKVPELTSYQLKREGQPTETVVRAAKSPGADAQPADVSPWTTAYAAARDKMRDEYKTARKEHPKAFLGGELAGALAVPLPGPGKAKGLAKIANYMKQGAGIGTAAGLGNSEADLLEGEYGDALYDTGFGTAFGTGVGGALGVGAMKLDPVLQQLAARRAYKALDPYMATLNRSLGSKLGRNPAPSELMGEVERLGERALDEGIIPEGKLARWASSETLGDRSAALLEEAGQMKSGFVDMAQQALGGNPVSMGQLATRLEQEAASAALDPARMELSRKLAREAAAVRQAIVNRASAGFVDPAAQTLQDAEALKTAMQKQADYGLDLARRGGATEEAKRIAARLAKEQTEQAIEKGLGPDDLEQFIALKNRYGDLAKLEEIATHGSVRNFRNQVLGQGDKQAAGIGAAMGKSTPEAGAMAVGLGALNKFARTRGSSGLARTLSNAAKSSDALTPASSLEPWSRFLREEPDEEPGL